MEEYTDQSLQMLVYLVVVLIEIPTLLTYQESVLLMVQSVEPYFMLLMDGDRSDVMHLDWNLEH